MDAQAYLSPDDARTAEGWPNPRWRMQAVAAIDIRIAEDGRRIAAEKADGACTLDDLTRLGWRLEQVRAAQARQAAEAEALERDIARTKATVRDLRATGDFVEADTVCLVPCLREPSLTDEDVAFGCEEAA